jgi:hypothetical protein
MQSIIYQRTFSAVNFKWQKQCFDVGPSSVTAIYNTLCSLLVVWLVINDCIGIYCCLCMRFSNIFYFHCRHNVKFGQHCVMVRQSILFSKMTQKLRRLRNERLKDSSLRGRELIKAFYNSVHRFMSRMHRLRRL